MTDVTTKVLDLVTSRQQAEEVVAKLLKDWSSDTAFDKVVDEATKSKQSVNTLVRRRVRNLFRSFNTYR